nr:MAG TPA: hypothetical protein [Caudoviricetes sp.]
MGKCFEVCINTGIVVNPERFFISCAINTKLSLCQTV